MTSLAITGIAHLVTNDPSIGDGPLGVMTDAAIVIDDAVVAWVGPTTLVPATDERLHARGRAVIPGFVDSHAHPAFAGDRVRDFVGRMTGQPYAAGGIRTTVAATRAASDDDLRRRVSSLLTAMSREGITTVEAKSGYGLTVEDEARALRILREFTEETTFLGAHVVPQEYADERAAYLALVTGPMLEACAPHARWIDVFCDRGAFDADETRAVLEAGMAAGLLPRLHGNQLEAGPGIALAVEFGAASVDHCTFATDADVDLLAGSATVATLLPGAEFCTRSPYPDARRLLDAGVTVAIATDCNPGTSYVTSMSWCIAMAVREMRMSPDEALWAATMGGARALRREDVGHLAVGAQGDLVVLDAPSHDHVPYRPGTSLIALVVRRGTLLA